MLLSLSNLPHFFFTLNFWLLLCMVGENYTELAQLEQVGVFSKTHIRIVCSWRVHAHTYRNYEICKHAIRLSDSKREREREEALVCEFQTLTHAGSSHMLTLQQMTLDPKSSNTSRHLESHCLFSRVASSPNNSAASVGKTPQHTSLVSSMRKFGDSDTRMLISRTPYRS